MSEPTPEDKPLGWDLDKWTKLEFFGPGRELIETLTLRGASMTKVKIPDGTVYVRASAAS